MANEFKVRKGLIVQGSGSIILDIQGSQGELFSVTDSLSGSLFSVNDISGIPIMEVFSDNTIKMGTFNQEAIIVSGSRTGMGIATPQAKLHISGATSQQLLEIDAGGSATPVFVVSGSGNVGINETNPSARLEIRGSGATSATTALRVENSNASASLTILDDGTSAFNTSHLYVSGSGLVGIGTTLPTAELHISGANADALFRASSPTTTGLFVSGSGRVGIGTTNPRVALHISAGDISLDGARYLDWNSGDNRIIGGSAGGYSLQFQTWTGAALTEKMRISGSGEVGIGVTAMTAKLHVSGASNAGLFEIDSPAVNNIIYVSGSGNVGIGTNLPSADLHISGASADSLLRVGSPTDSSILFVTGSGRVGIGTTSLDSKLHISSNGGYQLRVAASASFSSSLMVSGSFGFVGIGVESPQSILHVNDRPEFNNVTGNVPVAFLGNYQNITTFYNNNNQDNTVLGEPAAWMNIKCDGTEYLIPLYTS